ncbi:MAG: DUF5063 domain-containing protein [Bacteroidaceae bacterium]|nr:DUF5063 domain-containing protein [Bacteroidaceae bacterium]
MEKEKSLAFSKDVIEFTTVATEYCKFLETAQGMGCRQFVETNLKLLPLLYLKAQFLPLVEVLGDGDVEESVSEDDYEYIRSVVISVMGAHDDYLDVFVEDMKYSVEPIRKCISEDLSDIYQDLRNFLGVYRNGMEEPIIDALYVLRENFAHYWGQTLVNTMRALHDVLYNQDLEVDEDDL